MMRPHPLDNPVRSSLAGPHAHLAQRHGGVLRYPADVSPFVGMPDEPTTADWDSLAALAGPGAHVAMAGLRVPPPEGWEFTPIGDGVQMVGAGAAAGDTAGGDAAGGDTALGDTAGGDTAGGETGPGAAETDGDIVRLTAADVPEMLDLTRRTKPGPFLPRTIDLGTYLGIRRDGALVAMAGERLHPPGWTEISAVCTDERWRGHGLATRLVRVLMAGIRARGQTPFLHAVADNVTAIRLYEHLGFRVRAATTFAAVRVPDRPLDIVMPPGARPVRRG